MSDETTVYRLLSQANRPCNAIFRQYTKLLHAVSCDMFARPAIFGFELMEYMKEQLRRVPGVYLESQFFVNWEFSDLGIVAADSLGELERSLVKMKKVAAINPFEKDMFEKAEKRFRKKCKDSLKLKGAAELPSLRHEFVQFMQAAHYFAGCYVEGETRVKPFARQIFYITEPQILRGNIGEAYGQIADYIANLNSQWMLDGDLPGNFDVRRELSLGKLMKQRLFDSASLEDQVETQKRSKRC